MEATEGEPLGLLPYRFEPTSHESDTFSESDSDRELPADYAACMRVITQLGVRIPSALLSRPKASVAVVGNWRTQGTFLVMWRVSSASQISP